MRKNRAPASNIPVIIFLSKVGTIFLHVAFYYKITLLIRFKTATMARKYSKAAQEKVHEELEGKLKSSGSGKTVTDPKQAIAIRLLEARRNGRKVPDNPNEGKLQ